MTPNTGGPASEKTLLDEFAGQALAGLCASPETQMPFDVMHRLAYDHAEAMLAEKARREAVDHPVIGLDAVACERDRGIDRIAKLEALNRELVEACLESADLITCPEDSMAQFEDNCLKAEKILRKVINKAKEVA